METTRITVLPSAASPPRLQAGGGVLRVLPLALTPTRCRLALVPTVALLLGGDHVRLEVTVGEGMNVELVETTGTVAYHGRGRPCSWCTTAELAPGARLRWEGLPFVVSDGARVLRQASLTLGEGAVALLRETLVLGRSGQRGGELRSVTEAVGADGMEILVEDLDLRSDRHLPGLLGESRVLDSVTQLGRRPPPSGTLPAHAARLDLEEEGALVRVLADHTHDTGIASVQEEWEAAS